jgi:two-component system LytT family sensor kinase
MKPGTPEERAKRRADEYIGLLWHIAAFVIVNPFLLFLDWRTGHRIDWAYWVIIPWAVGLAFHVFAYVIGDRAHERAYERFLEKEKAKDKRDKKG